MVVVDLRKTDWQERDLNVVLEQHGLVANSTTLPRRAGDISTLGLRLGSTPMSIRGLGDDGFVLPDFVHALMVNFSGGRGNVFCRLAEKFSFV